MLNAESSAALRDRLVREIASIDSAESGADWAYLALPAKDTLTASDARMVQLAFQLRLSALEGGIERGEKPPAGGASESSTPASEPASEASGYPEPQPGNARPTGIDKGVLTFSEVRRYRDRAHIKFVASQPCLVCGRKPCDSHHLRFAQVRALGRKVSDEFTVPLCRLHHRELHRARNEADWWSKLGIDALETALKLWTRFRNEPASSVATS